MRTWFKARITWDSEDEGDKVKICHKSATWFPTYRTMHAKDLYRMKCHSSDTRSGTQSIIHFEIVSVDVYDIFPTTKNPNEVMWWLSSERIINNLHELRQVGAWEGGERTQTIKSTQEDTNIRTMINKVARARARARHRIKISERGKDACKHSYDDQLTLYL